MWNLFFFAPSKKAFGDPLALIIKCMANHKSQFNYACCFSRTLRDNSGLPSHWYFLSHKPLARHCQRNITLFCGRPWTWYPGLHSNVTLLENVVSMVSDRERAGPALAGVAGTPQSTADEKWKIHHVPSTWESQRLTPGSNKYGVCLLARSSSGKSANLQSIAS